MRRIFLCICGLAWIGLGCGGETLNGVRTVTYPPDFHYITRQEILTTMGSLAFEVEALDRIMWQGEGPRPEDREQVVAILSRMRTLARQLKQREHSNHPRIDLHAPQLQEDVERALASARREPASYYYVGRISGACASCHVPRHRPAPERPLTPGDAP